MDTSFSAMPLNNYLNLGEIEGFSKATDITNLLTHNPVHGTQFGEAH